MLNKIKAMAIPVAALVAGAATIGSGAMNMAATSKMNRKTIQYNERMYGTQRADALRDFHMMNEYNSPTAQMERLRAAGLNPRLAYGDSSGANQAATVRSTDAKPFHGQAPQMDARGVGDAFMGFYDMQAKKATVDNLKVQNEVMQQEKLLKAAQVLATTAQAGATGVTTAQGQFNLQQAERLKDVSVETAIAGLRKVNIESDVALDRNEREAAMNASTITKAAEEVLTIRQQRETNLVQRRQIEQQIENLRRDTRLKDLDIELKRLGIQPGDPMWSRALGRILNNKDFNPRMSIEWKPEDKKAWMEKYAPKSGYSEWKKKRFGN